MMRRLVVMACMGVVGCVQTTTVVCGQYVCSAASVCSPAGDRCVLPSQVDACTGKVDADTCSYQGVTDGACGAGVCEPAGCGNGVIEPERMEICDDGNEIPFDGCSSDCTSTEVCGDGIVDSAKGELCDCGMPGMQIAGCAMENSDMPGATCRLGCRPARCGDGIKDPHEWCDDGNVDPGDGCRADCTGRWTVMPSGVYANLTAVWGTGPDNVYAVGRDTILHFDGVTWTRMPVPFTDMQINDIWGTPARAYAVGPAKVGGQLQGRIAYLTSSGWQAGSGFPGESTSYTGMFAIHGRDIDDFWVVNNDGLMRYWNGSTWSANHSCPGAGGFSSVWTEPGTNRAYAAGTNGQLCTYDGTTWILTQTGTLPAGVVWGTSSTDIYALGHKSDDLELVSRTTNGVTWTSLDDARLIVTPNGIGGFANDVIVVGDLGRAIQFNGTTWSLSPTSVSANLRDVWGYAPGKAFVVGDNGTILY